MSRFRLLNASSTSEKLDCVFILPWESEVSLDGLEMGYLMSVLRRDGFSCALATPMQAEDEEMITLLAHSKPSLICISLGNLILTRSVNLPRARAIGKAVRARLGSNVHITAVGHYPTFATATMIENPDWHFLDSLVRGEGESVIGPLLSALEKKAPLESIPGIVVVQYPTTFESLAIPVWNLDSLPWPSRELLGDGKQPIVQILSSRGCNGYCTFCPSTHKLYQNHAGPDRVWRGRSAKDVVDELESLITHHNVNTFLFVDLTYEGIVSQAGKDRIRSIAELIMERQLRIYYEASMQSCNWTEADADLLQLLFKSGLERVYLGIESGSEKVLRAFGKRSTVQQNRDAVQLFRKNHFHVSIGIIMFHPYADWQDIEDTANFLIDEGLGYMLFRFIRRLELYPGAAITTQLTRDKLVLPSYHTNFDLFGYQYQNPLVGRMAIGVNSMFGESWLRYAGLPVGSAYTIRGVDILLHNYIFRCMRLFGDEPVIKEMLATALSNYDAEQSSLTQFNAAIFGDFLRYAKAGQDIPREMAVFIENRYAEAMKRFSSIHMHLALELTRLNKEHRMHKEIQTISRNESMRL